MATTRIKAVESIRAIRDAHADALTGKSQREVVAFFRAAGKAAEEKRRANRANRTKRAATPRP